jgi:hypothetical protein
MKTRAKSAKESIILEREKLAGMNTRSFCATCFSEALPGLETTLLDKRRRALPRRAKIIALHFKNPAPDQRRILPKFARPDENRSKVFEN